MTEVVATPFDVRLMNVTAGIIYVVFGAAVVVALVWWAANQAVFAVRAIAVTGEVSHNNALTLRANVLPHLNGSFLTLNLASARRSFEAVPWVRKAVVRRDFPNRLKVILEEHRPAAYWGAEGESQLLNTFGEVFEANLGEVEHEALPRLNGPQEQAPRVLGLYRTLQPRFLEQDLTIEALELSASGSWQVHLDNGAEVELGRGEDKDVEARAARFLQTLTQVSARYNRRPDDLESADLRHSGGYALRLRGVTTVTAEAAAAQKK